jgi:hypothetical protein
MKLRASRVVASAAADRGGLRRTARRSPFRCHQGELRAVLPGDEIVKSPMWESTRAITIDASAGDVWPWIVQMGYPRFRAAWYTPHWLDRLQWGIREGSGGERVRPDLQHLRVGDRIPDSPDWSVFFTVERVEPRRALVLHSTRHLIKPMRAIDFSWAFVLDSAAGDQTRLIMRARASCQPRAAWLALGSLSGIGDFVNASVMLHGIKRRCERSCSRCGRAPCGISPACSPVVVLRRLAANPKNAPGSCRCGTPVLGGSLAKGLGSDLLSSRRNDAGRPKDESACSKCDAPRGDW